MSAVIKVILTTVLVINTFIFMKSHTHGAVIIYLILLGILIISMITTFVMDIIHSLTQIDKEDEEW